MDRIAVLVPCYNEEQTVGKVIDDWKRELSDAVIYVYDNNSTDGTAATAAEHGAVVKKNICRAKGMSSAGCSVR